MQRSVTVNKPCCFVHKYMVDIMLLFVKSIKRRAEDDVSEAFALCSGHLLAFLDKEKAAVP